MMKILITTILLFLSISIYSQVKFENYVLLGNDTLYLTTGSSVFYDSIIFTADYIVADTGGFILPKDTFIEYKPNKWYNEATLEYIDSTSYYNWKITFVKTLKEYKQNCYNDSSLICVLRDNELSVDGIIIDTSLIRVYNYNEAKLLYDYVDSIYIHKKPTFEDFLNWIDK